MVMGTIFMFSSMDPPKHERNCRKKNVALTCVGTDTENKSVLLQKCLEFIPNDSDDTWKIL